MSDQAKQENSQYLTFTLAEEVFALDIGTVREVLEYRDITRIPLMPSFMQGVINLRGHAVPVIDMRQKFGMPASERTVNTCVIIVEVKRNGESAVFGALADSVREVVDIDHADIEAPPLMGAAVDAQFLRGIGKLEGDFVLLLDIGKSFSLDELTTMSEVLADSADAA
ncbi:chemotaxis protein CheW [Desulfocurvus sp. DL9XJH121]